MFWGFFGFFSFIYFFFSLWTKTTSMFIVGVNDGNEYKMIFTMIELQVASKWDLHLVWDTLPSIISVI